MWLLLLAGCSITSDDSGLDAPMLAGDGTDDSAGDAAGDAASTDDTGATEGATEGAGTGSDPGTSDDGDAGSDGVDDGNSGEPPPPPGMDTDEPFPIDRGDDPGAPGSYKGLPLRLVDNGQPEVTAVDGVIGVVCIGMSNATQECSDYISKLESGALGEVSPAVRVIDCAVSSHAIEKWNDPAFDDALWNRCLDRVAEAGLGVEQIRVLYHKAANQFTAPLDDPMTPLPPYPDPDSDYLNFVDNLGAFAQRVPQMFPGVQAVYTTSRSYGGFSTKPARGEPLSYEEGHALNTWLADNAEVGGVWYGWGPYIWAPDCADGTNGSDVCYVREDYQEDGVHPHAGARDKISAMIHARLLAESWYAP